MIVLDSSAVIELLTDGPAGVKVDDAMFDQQLHAPALIEYEVTSALCGQLRGALLSAEEAYNAFLDFEQLSIDLWPLGDPQRVFELRHNFSAYDADYVALAEALQCPLITCDKKWLRAPAGVHSADIRVL